MSVEKPLARLQRRPRFPTKRDIIRARSRPCCSRCLFFRHCFPTLPAQTPSPSRLPILNLYFTRPILRCILANLYQTSHRWEHTLAAHAMQAYEFLHHPVLPNSAAIIRGAALLLTLLEPFEHYFFIALDTCTTELLLDTRQGLHCNNIYHFLHSYSHAFHLSRNFTAHTLFGSSCGLPLFWTFSISWLQLMFPFWHFWPFSGNTLGISMGQPF
jgi:hypothetical protein